MAAELGTGGRESRSGRPALVRPHGYTTGGRHADRIRVAIMSDVLLHREGLASLLGQPRCASPTWCTTRQKRPRVREGNVDVVVVDLGAGNVASVQTLLSSAPEARVVVLGAAST